MIIIVRKSNLIKYNTINQFITNSDLKYQHDNFNNKNDDYFLRPMLQKFSCVFDQELVITAENQDRYTSAILYTYYINIRNVHFHQAI